MSPGPRLESNSTAHDAFISYSHRRDKELAFALRRGIRAVGRKSWFRVRNSLDIFLDQSNLSANPELWPSIQAELIASKYVILLACPESAKSEWVRKEIQTRLTHEPGSPRRLLIVLTDGEIHWDGQTNDFDWQASTGLPDCLAGTFAEEPHWVDARWTRSSNALSLQNPDFIDIVANLAAPLRGIPKTRIIDEEFQDRRKAARRWMGVSAVLALLGLALTVSLFETKKQERIATSRRLIAESELAAREPDLLERSVLLGLEAMRRQPSPEAENVVRQSLLLLPKPVAQFSHDGYTVSRIVFSRDGRLLATASRDGVARIFDLRSAKEIRSFKSPSPLLTVDLDAKGSRVLTAAEDQKLRVFSMETGQELRNWDVHDSNASASISPDGEYVAVGTHPGDALLLSVASGEAVWSAHQNEPILLAAFNGHGDSCVFAARNGAVSKLSLPARRAASFTSLYSAATHLALSGDGNWLASGTVDGRVQLHRLDSGAQQLAAAYGSPVSALALDTAGEHVAIGLVNGGTLVLSSADAKEHLGVRNSSAVIALAFSPNSSYVGIASLDRSARLIDVRTGAEVLRRGHNGVVTAFAFSHDGRYAASGAGDGIAAVYESVPAGLSTFAVPVGQQVIALSCVDRSCAASFKESHVSIFDVSGREAVHFDDLSSVDSLKLSGDGRYLAVVEKGGAGKLIRVADKATVARFDASRMTPVLVFAPGSKRFAAATRNNTLTVIDTATGQLVAKLTHWGAVCSASFAADGNQIVTASFDRNVRIFDLKVGSELRRWGGQESPFAVAFSPKDDTFVTGYGQGMVTLRRASGQTMWTAPALDYVMTVAFDPAGDRVATGGRDKAVHVLSARDGSELLRIDLGGVLAEVEFTADGASLRTMDDRSIVRSHPLAPGLLIAEARSRLTRDFTKGERWRYFGEGPRLPGGVAAAQSAPPAEPAETPGKEAVQALPLEGRRICATDSHEAAVTGKLDCADLEAALRTIDPVRVAPLRQALEQGEFSLARRLLDEAGSASNSQSVAAATVFAARAGLSRLQLRFVSALPDAERACKLAPNRPDYCFLLARTLIDCGDRPKASEVLRTVLGNLPPPERQSISDTVLIARARFTQASLALADNKSADADRGFREANAIFLNLMKQQPAYGMLASRTFIRIGSLHEQRNEMDQAEVAYRRAVQIANELMAGTGRKALFSGDIHQRILGRYLLEHQRTKEAEIAFQEALRLYEASSRANPVLVNGGWSETVHNMGVLYERTGRGVEVMPMLQRTLARFRTLRPYNPPAYDVEIAYTLTDLGVHLLSNEKMEEARPLLETAHQLYAGLLVEDPETYGDGLAKTSYGLVTIILGTAGDPTKACELAKEAQGAARAAVLKDAADKAAKLVCSPM